MGMLYNLRSTKYIRMRIAIGIAPSRAPRVLLLTLTLLRLRLKSVTDAGHEHGRMRQPTPAAQLGAAQLSGRLDLRELVGVLRSRVG